MGTTTIGPIPLSSFPFPYKYLIGVGFYFYIKRQISNKKLITPIEYFLFLPAIIYGFLRLYWYINIHTGIDKYLFVRVYQTGFFLYNDIAYLLFNVCMMVYTIRFLNKYKDHIKGTSSVHKNWKWLHTFSWVFIVFIVLNLLHQIIAISFNLEDSGQFYYVILLLNSLYIYWIGYIGFTKSKLLFRSFVLKDIEQQQFYTALKNKLDYIMTTKEVYTNKHLKVVDLATLLDIKEKELSTYLQETTSMSFSDFINSYRIDKVKTLLQSPQVEKYTLVAIGEKAGFSSKSSFNAVFKKATGMTPSQYKASYKN